MDIASGLTCRDGFLVPLSPNSTTPITWSSILGIDDGYEAIKVESLSSEPCSYSNLTGVNAGVMNDIEPLDIGATTDNNNITSKLSIVVGNKSMIIIVAIAHLFVAIGFATLFVTRLYRICEVLAI